MIRTLSRYAVTSPPRTRLTANTNFYVNSVSGSDSNGGTSLARAKATIQAMIDDLQANYDLGDYKAIINLSGGTAISPYEYGGIDIRSPFVGGGVMPPVEIVGDVVTPEKVVISTASNAVVVHGANIGLSGMKIETDLAGGGSIIAAFAGANVFHDNIWFAGAGHECIEAHTGATIRSRGPSRVSGRYDSWCHFTEQSQIIWEDYDIALVAADGVTLGVRDITDPDAGPRGQEYIFGGNRASCTLGRVDFTGSFSAGLDPGDGITYLSRHFNHISATLNLSSCTGIDGLFPGYSPPVNEAGGRTVYDSGVGDIIYVRSDAIGDNGDGYANTIPRAFLTLAAAMAYLAKRPPDQIFARVPKIKLAAGTYIPANTLINIPGCDEVIIEGDEATPANVIISSGANCFESDGRSTLWHLRGMTVTSSAGSGISCINGGRIGYQNIVFGACVGSQITVGRDAYVFSTDVFTVTAGAARFLQCVAGKAAILHTGTWAAGTYAYSTRTVDMDEGALVRWTGTRTIIGTVTGNRTLVAANSVLNLNGSLQNTLPGSVDVAATTGGIIK